VERDDDTGMMDASATPFPMRSASSSRKTSLNGRPLRVTSPALRSSFDSACAPHCLRRCFHAAPGLWPCPRLCVWSLQALAKPPRIERWSVRMPCAKRSLTPFKLGAGAQGASWKLCLPTVFAAAARSNRLSLRVPLRPSHLSGSLKSRASLTPAAASSKLPRIIWTCVIYWKRVRVRVTISVRVRVRGRVGDHYIGAPRPSPQARWMPLLVWCDLFWGLVRRGA